MFVATGKLKAIKGKEKELEQVLSKYPPLVHNNEKNTLLYIMHRNTEDPSEFFFYELYPAKKYFEEHLAQPYIKEAFEKFSKLIREDPEICEYEVVIGDSGERLQT